jgi:hypothetical protein
MIIKLFIFSVKLSVMLNGKTVEELSCVVHARQNILLTLISVRKTHCFECSFMLLMLLVYKKYF